MTTKDPKEKEIKKDDSEENLISSILPSYHMFQSTISKRLDSQDEDYSREPPTYEMTPVSSAVSISGIQSPFTPSEISINEFPFPIVDPTEDEQIEIWENTILANVHKLKNLTKSDSAIPKNLEMKINITSKVCQKGVKPDLVDILDVEFKQGDYIHGFVTIENHSNEPIHFDMVYVVFEGSLVVLENNAGFIDTQLPKVIHKFLNMTDLFASWSFANIDRLTTDHGDPHDWCEGETDPYDNTILSLDLKRQFMPGVKYKRFFSFRVPDKLLDDICEVHNLNGHTLLPPTLGFPKYVLKPSQLLGNKMDVNDLCFLDTSISYSVECRVIGKAHDYNLDLQKDQYVIANECRQLIRVVPDQSALYVEDAEEVYRYYSAFIKSIVDIIEFGKSILKSRESFNEMTLSPMPSSDSKLRQLYKTVRLDNKKSSSNPGSIQFFENIYQNIIPYRKKGLLQTKKEGLISLSSPKTTYSIKYVPPPRYRKNPVNDAPLISIPLKITHHSSKSAPDVKSIKAELVVATIKSAGHPFPVEFTHDIFIKQDELKMIGAKPDNECFNEEVARPCQKYIREITDLIEKVGSDTLRVDRKLYDDVKSMALCSAKFSVFQIQGQSLWYESETGEGRTEQLEHIPWVTEGETISKIFNLDLDIRKCVSKVHGIPKNANFFDYVNLVPDNQTCFSIRMHYIKVMVKLANGDTLTTKLPLKVTN